jgi:hypothetical protein
LQATASPILSSTSAFLQSLDPTATSPGPRRSEKTQAPLLGFGSLQHIPAKRVHDPRMEPPPASFRLQGLATLLTACSPRRLVGSVSSRQRSWDFPLRSFRLPGGGNGFPRSPHPPAVRPRKSPVRIAPAGIATTGYRALALPRSPRTRGRCLASRRLDAPLGFSPSRVVLPTALYEARAPHSPCVLRRKIRPKTNLPTGT